MRGTQDPSPSAFIRTLESSKRIVALILGVVEIFFNVSGIFSFFSRYKTPISGSCPPAIIVCIQTSYDFLAARTPPSKRFHQEHGREI